MNSRQAIKIAIDAGDAVGLAYLDDLTDAELLKRPAAGCNHINWQVGHLIASENYHLTKVAPELVTPLPGGFAEKYSKETVGSDDPSAFLTKAELLKVHAQQRAATLAALDRQSDADLDRETGVPYAATVGALLALAGHHWLMHAGQWAVVRRQLGRPPLF
jgi:uncharacterized damage-inducible protein DinB